MTPRILPFSTGRVRERLGTRGAWRYLGGGWREETMPVNAFLVAHSEGWCLVDTGQTARAGQPGYFSWWYPYFRLSRFELREEDEIVAQLGRAGIRTDQVGRIVLTHLHTDHVGGLAAFPHAEVLVARSEWTPAQGWPGRLRGYQPQYWPDGVIPTLVEFSGPAIGPFPASHDVVGDGTLMMVPMPGHTPGHAGLLVHEAGQFRYLCAGDAARRGADLALHAPEIAEWCRKTGVAVLTAHDDAVESLLRAAGGPR